MVRMRNRAGLLGLIGLTALVWAQSAQPSQAAPPSEDSSAAKTTADPMGSNEAEVHWQAIMLGGERIGYVRARQMPADEQGHIQTDTKTKMTFKRFGQELTIEISVATTETADGELLGYQYLMKMPTGTTKMVGEVDGDQLTITSTIADQSDTRTAAFDPNVKSPAYQDRLFKQADLSPGETISFQAYLPELSQPTTITITAKGWEKVELPDGTTQKLQKMTVVQSALPSLPITVYVDESGEMVLTEMQLLGQTMQVVAVSKAEALREIIGKELDLSVTSLIPVTRIDDPHETSKIVYKIHVPDENAAALFIEDGTQQVERIDRETVQVTVIAKPIPKKASAGQAGKEFTQPTQMIQSDNPLVRAHVAKATDPSQSDAEAALALEGYVHDVIKKKNYSTAFASAATVAEHLEGDCSEHAVLLAALLRARGIPSRLAAGLVYIPSAAKMGGHMWTEAKLGQEWIPLDATLGAGGIGAGHIKIGTTSLGNKAPLPVACLAPLLNLGAGTTIQIVEVERADESGE